MAFSANVAQGKAKVRILGCVNFTSEGEDGVVDRRHHVQDLVEEVGHVLRREVRRGCLVGNSV